MEILSSRNNTVSDAGSIQPGTSNGILDKSSNHRNLQRNKSERLAWMDLLRVICLFLVVLIHVCACVSGGAAVRGVSSTECGLAGLIVSCFYVVSRGVAVPLLIMISGALLLGRNESVTTFYRKRFGKILVPFLAWSCISILCLWLAGQTLRDGTPITLTSSLGAILSGNIVGGFWFLYMLISLYLAAPFLSILVRNAPKSTMMWFLILWWFAIAVFPVLDSIAQESLDIEGITVYFQFHLVAHWVGLFVAGYVLKDVLISKRWALIALAVWFCLSLMRPVSTHVCYNYPDSSITLCLIFMDKYIFPIVLCHAVLPLMVFLAFRSLCDHPSVVSSRLGRIIISFAPLTFGIYLCHHLVFQPVMRKLALGSCDSLLLVLWAIPALSLLFFVVTAGVVYGMRRSRYLKFLVP